MLYQKWTEEFTRLQNSSNQAQNAKYWPLNSIGRQNNEHKIPISWYKAHICMIIPKALVRHEMSKWQRKSSKPSQSPMGRSHSPTFVSYSPQTTLFFNKSIYADTPLSSPSSSGMHKSLLIRFSATPYGIISASRGWNGTSKIESAAIAYVKELDSNCCSICGGDIHRTVGNEFL